MVKRGSLWGEGEGEEGLCAGGRGPRCPERLILSVCRQNFLNLKPETRGKNSA